MVAKMAPVQPMRPAVQRQGKAGSMKPGNTALSSGIEASSKSWVMTDSNTAPVLPSASLSKRPRQLARYSSATEGTYATKCQRGGTAEHVLTVAERPGNRAALHHGHPFLAQFFGFILGLIDQASAAQAEVA